MNGADGVCGSPSGVNPCLRDDSRIKTRLAPVAGVLGFLWDAKQGTFGQTSAPYPYLRGAVVDLTTWSLVSDVRLGYSDTAAIYPNVAINPRGGLGLTMTVGGGTFYPSAVIGILDDVSNGTWELQTLQTGGGDPIQSEWGDFLTVRPASGGGNSWVATGYTMQNGATQPLFAWFGRQRDDPFSPTGLACGTPITSTVGAQVPSQTLATFTAPSNSIADYTATVDWGDGTTSGAALSSPAPKTGTAFAGHAFSTAGILTVTVTVTDATGGSASCTLVATIAGTVYSAVSRAQYMLQNSDGVTWREIDGARLSLTVPVSSAATAILSANVDLWTANAGYNQDIGIFVNSGNGTQDQLVAWKESGGFAGTSSPNAAFVQTTYPMAPGTYSIKLKWKTNKPSGATIVAGAGPAAPFSPTRLTARIVPTTTPLVAKVNPAFPQYRLDSSNGITWQAVDAVKLSLGYTPGAPARPSSAATPISGPRTPGSTRTSGSSSMTTWLRGRRAVASRGDVLAQCRVRANLVCHECQRLIHRDPEVEEQQADERIDLRGRRPVGTVLPDQPPAGVRCGRLGHKRPGQYQSVHTDRQRWAELGAVGPANLWFHPFIERELRGDRQRQCRPVDPECGVRSGPGDPGR